MSYKPARSSAIAAALAGMVLPAAAWAADIPGNAATKATLPIAPEFTKGTFEKKGDHDWYRVTLEKGKDYALALSSPDVFRDLLTLRGPDGQFRAAAFKNEETKAKAGASKAAPADEEVRIEFRPDATGTYFLDVGQQGQTLGGYGVRATTDCRHDPSTQCTLTVGTTQTRLRNGYDDADWLRVTLDQAKSYTIAVDAPTEVRLTLRDGDDNQLAFAYSDEMPIRGFKPPRTGAYYVFPDAQFSGLYKITVKAEP